MSRKYNGQHPERGRSNYKLRLLKRGLRKTPLMHKLEDLRNMQLARIARTGYPWPTRAELEEEDAA